LNTFILYNYSNTIFADIKSFHYQSAWTHITRTLDTCVISHVPAILDYVVITAIIIII